MNVALRPTADPAWILASNAHAWRRESNFESRFSISNGFLGIRAGQSRGADQGVPARTYVAGLFDTLGSSVPELVPAADWLQLRISLPGGLLVQHPDDIASHHVKLDMRRGVLLSEARLAMAPDLDFRLETLRLVSLDERAVGLQVVRLEVEAGTADIVLEASFGGINSGLVVEQLDADRGLWRTPHPGKELAIAAGSSLLVDDRDLAPFMRGSLKSSWRWQSQPGQIATFTRLVTIVRGDGAGADPAGTARDRLEDARRIGWRGVLAAHETAWAKRWRCSDIEIDGDPGAQQALRFALYHLNSAANPADERVSIGARALTGDDYRGHVFWDTEIFLLPFYVLTWPEAARALLMYRHHTLNGAREKAARMGWRGALYAWESADTGAETTPDQVIGLDGKVIDVLCGKQEQHISADIAYAVWQYWQATGDEAFLCAAGAEIILETARFWVSRAEREADGRRHIRGVIGPDEYHEHIDDNAYTNVMARWNIRRAVEVAALLRQRWPDRWRGLSTRLGLDDAELRQWSAAAEALAVAIDPATGLMEQFDGYFSLEDIDLTQYADRTLPLDVVLGRERVQRSQVVKQADVVALLALLPEEFTDRALAGNFHYYRPRCGHGSSLSPAMHGMVAARLGDPEMALRFFRQTAAIDLSNTMTGKDGGVHIAALGGMWMLVVFGLAGVSPHGEDLAIDPHLPKDWRSLRCTIAWRGRCIGLRIDQGQKIIEATLEAGDPMVLLVHGERRELRPGPALRLSTERGQA